MPGGIGCRIRQGIPASRTGRAERRGLGERRDCRDFSGRTPRVHQDHHGTHARPTGSKDYDLVKGLTPRLRMIAGPNGSGKSTLKTVLPPELLGVYLNPDEIEAQIRQHGCLNVEAYGVQPDKDIDSRLLAFFQHSPFLIEAGLTAEAVKLKSTNGRADFSQVAINSCFASVAADFLRQELLKQKTSFTLETVMSRSPSSKPVATSPETSSSA